MLTDMVVLKLLPYWGPVSPRSALRENCSLVRTEIVCELSPLRSLGWCIALRQAERCRFRHFFCNAAQSFGKEWETVYVRKRRPKP